jgi:hypothetical protein
MKQNSEVSNFLSYAAIIRDFCADISQRHIAELFRVKVSQNRSETAQKSLEMP